MLLIVAAGLQRPEVQWVVQGVAGPTAVWLDLAWASETGSWPS